MKAAQQNAVNSVAPTMPAPEGTPTFAWKNGRLFHSCRPLAWGGGEDFKDALERAGFSRHASISLGDEFEAVGLNVYDRRDESDQVPRWLADLMIADTSYTVWVDDLPDLVDLLHYFAPTIAAIAALSDRQERLDQEAEQRKAEFRESRMWGG